MYQLSHTESSAISCYFQKVFIDRLTFQELPLEQKALLEALELPDALVLPCAGVRFPGGQLLRKLTEGDPTGQICTNRAMQCIQGVEREKKTEWV